MLYNSFKPKGRAPLLINFITSSHHLLQVTHPLLLPLCRNFQVFFHGNTFVEMGRKCDYFSIEAKGEMSC